MPNVKSTGSLYLRQMVWMMESFYRSAIQNVSQQARAKLRLNARHPLPASPGYFSQYFWKTSRGSSIKYISFTSLYSEL